MANNSYYSYVPIKQYSVHIAECYSTKCISKLSELGRAFRDQNIGCIFEYRTNGSHQRQFDEYFKASTFTIIHTCPHLWKKISLHECMEGSSETIDKVMCVTLHDPSCCQDEDMEELDEFYNIFNIQDVSQPDKLDTFVSVVVAELDLMNTKPWPIRKCYSDIKGIPRKPSVPARDPTGAEELQHDFYLLTNYYFNAPVEEKEIVEILVNLRSKFTFARNEEDEASAHCPEFVHCPDIFGDTHNPDFELSIRYCGDLEAEAQEFFAIEHLQGLTDIINAFIKKHPTLRKTPPTHYEKLRFVLQMILPEFYNKNCLLGLARVAICDEPVLQERALILLEIKMLKISTTKEDVGSEEMFSVCRLLAASLRNMWKLEKEGEPVRQHIQVQTLHVLLIVLSETCLKCQKSRNADGWSSLVKEVKDMKPRGTKSDREQNKMLETFLDRHLLNNISQNYLERGPVKLLKEKKPNQFIAVFQCLKEIFLEMDSKRLDFLLAYVKATEDKESSSVSINTLVLRGTSHFLSYISKEVAHCNIQGLCTTAISIIEKVFKRWTARDKWNDASLESLLFVNTPKIRQGAIDLLLESFRCGEITMVKFLLHIIKHLLCPLLVTDIESECSLMKRNGWHQVRGSFTGQSVMIIVRPSLDVKEWEGKETHFDIRDKRHHNQVTRLKCLDHPYIIRMFASHVDCIPHFYLVEDGHNLQMTLENFNDNGRCFTESQLLKFLVDVAAALEFCHSQQIVHGNLTADSLFLFWEREEETVKLGNFELAVDLRDQNVKTVKKNIAEIPTRFSAPETFRRSEFSKATDVWMFAVLMYEILSHGCLAYSNLGLPDEQLVYELFLQVFHEPPTICQEKCMQTQHTEFILKCMDRDPRKRPTIEKVKSKLDCKQFKGCRKSTPAKVDNRDLKMGLRVKSTEFEKGDPLHSYPGHTIVFPFFNIPGECIRHIGQHGTLYKTSHGFLMRQVGYGEFSHKTLEQISLAVHLGSLPWEWICTTDSFDCYLQESALEDLMTVVKSHRLGDHLENYLPLLLRVAEQVLELHKYFVLRDFRAVDFYVNPKSSDKQVYLLSLEKLMHKNEQMHNLTSSNHGRPSSKVTFSRNIFCFGNLLMDVLKELRLIQGGVEMHKPGSSTQSCSAILCELAQKCLHEDETMRPSMQMLVKDIKGLMAKRTVKKFKFSVKPMNPSSTDSSSSSGSSENPTADCKKREKQDCLTKDKGTFLKTVPVQHLQHDRRRQINDGLVPGHGIDDNSDSNIYPSDSPPLSIDSNTVTKELYQPHHADSAIGSFGEASPASSSNEFYQPPPFKPHSVGTLFQGASSIYSFCHIQSSSEDSNTVLKEAFSSGTSSACTEQISHPLPPNPHTFPLFYSPMPNGSTPHVYIPMNEIESTVYEEIKSLNEWGDHQNVIAVTSNEDSSCIVSSSPPPLPKRDKNQGEPPYLTPSSPPPDYECHPILQRHLAAEKDHKNISSESTSDVEILYVDAYFHAGEKLDLHSSLLSLRIDPTANDQDSFSSKSEIFV